MYNFGPFEPFASFALWYLAIPSSIVFTMLITTLRISKVFSNFFFSVIYNPFVDNYVQSEEVNQCKKIVFSQMQEAVDKREIDLRVLEIGAGPGNNFKYYPKNTQLTLLEPNNYFKDFIRTNEKSNPNITLKDLLIGFGENMSMIKDNSFDFVVGSFVLCSVRDVSLVLKEINRVLAPGGSYLFVEHGYGKRNFFQRTIQRLVNPFWTIFGNGCQIIKDTVVDIKNSGLFEDVSYFNIKAPQSSWLIWRVLIGNVVYGVAKNPIPVTVKKCQ